MLEHLICETHYHLRYVIANHYFHSKNAFIHTSFHWRVNTLCYRVVFELPIFHGASIFCSLMDTDKQKPKRAMLTLNELIHFCIIIKLFHFLYLHIY